MNSKEILEFEIPGHATRQEWSVYIIVATNQDKSVYYIGKVGDNRKGCNPIVSRIGNHLSLNKIHSQLRNKIENTTDYNYRVIYASFGKYNNDLHIQDLERINELERRLNLLLQQKGVIVLNPYKAAGFISKIKKEDRNNIITDDDMRTLKSLVEKAINYNSSMV